MRTNPANTPVLDALADWIVKVRWALEGCHEHVGTDGLAMVAGAEAVLLVAIDDAKVEATDD